MAKVKISEFNSNPALNTDIDGINIAENCPPSGINDAIRELMSQLKDWQSGTSNDPYVVGSSGSLTLNQGTANTVPYLNGSKVVTSGTALQFDGTNLGLGVTPSAWSAFKAFEVASTGNSLWSAGSNDLRLATNYVYNGGDKYVTTGRAATYIQTAGQHQWYNSASGTAGNAITFTQAMTLDASGNLGVGTTSPSTKLHVVQTTDANTDGIRVARSGNGTQYGVLSNYGGATWLTAVDTASGGNNILVFNRSSNGSTFTESARIDSSGNLLCGVTSATNDPAQGITLMQNGNIGNIGIGHANGTASGNSYVKFSYNATTIGNIAQSGTTAVLYNTTSDQRLKENIQDADSASSLIDALQVRQFDWKSDNSHQRYGFVAQELLTVAPEAVYQPEDAEAMMAVDYSKLVPMLVKEIQSLRKRLADAGIA